jgi:hypothetical protein
MSNYHQPSKQMIDQPIEELQVCLSLTQNTANHQEAEEQYKQLRDRLVGEDDDVARILDLMWKEILASRRSAFFWEEMCNVEQRLTERMAESHVQLRQNYLRLVQEQ